MSVSEIAPGWYKDPAEPSTQRYWTGEEWIGDPLPADAAPPPGPPAAPRGRTATPTTPAPADAPQAGQQPPGTQEPTAPGQPGQQGYPGPQGYPGAQGAPGPPQGWPGGPGWPGGQPGWPGGAPWPPGQAWPPVGPPQQVSPPPGAPPVPGRPAGAPPAWQPGMPLPGQPGWHPGIPLPPGSVLLPVQANPHGYPVAPLGLRLLARLIDIGVVLVLSAVATSWLVYTVIQDYAPFYHALWNAAVAGEDLNKVALPAIPSRTGTLTSIVIPLIIMALWWAYEVPATARGGQTFGKRIVGIKVLALESTEPLGIRRAFRRWNPLGIPVFLWSCFGVGFILQGIDSISPTFGGPLHLALHDRSAATVVVRSGRPGHEITPSPTNGPPTNGPPTNGTPPGGNPPGTDQTGAPR